MQAMLVLSDMKVQKAALEAMGDYADAANQALELRYQQAEKCIDTDRAAAIAAFGRLRVSGAAAATTATVIDVLTGDGHNHAVAAVTAVELYAS